MTEYEQNCVALKLAVSDLVGQLGHLIGLRHEYRDSAIQAWREATSLGISGAMTSEDPVRIEGAKMYREQLDSLLYALEDAWKAYDELKARHELN